MKLRSIIITLALLVSLPGFSQNNIDWVRKLLPSYIVLTGQGDSIPTFNDDELWDKGISIHFRQGKTEVNAYDPGYRAIVKALTTIPDTLHLCRLLVLRGSASPEGDEVFNWFLAHERAQAVTDSLRRYVILPQSAVEERYVGEDYAGLRHLIEKSRMPYKPEVMAILSQKYDNETTKAKLKGLDNGKAWQILMRDYFPQLRATRVVMVIGVVPPQMRKRHFSDSYYEPAPYPAEEEEPMVEDYRPWFAVKSNLLYDAAFTPNIELERWFGKNDSWSFMAEWNFPWWENEQKSRTYEVCEVGGELRYWFNRKYMINRNLRKGRPANPLTGMFFGLYGAWGYYDLEWDYEGEQGHAYSAGLTYGYATRLAKHWNMEFSVSAGWLTSPRYSHYEATRHDDILFDKYKKNFNYFGPTKLKISLVWLLGK